MLKFWTNTLRGKTNKTTFVPISLSFILFNERASPSLQFACQSVEKWKQPQQAQRNRSTVLKSSSPIPYQSKEKEKNTFWVVWTFRDSVVCSVVSCTPASLNLTLKHGTPSVEVIHTKGQVPCVTDGHFRSTIYRAVTFNLMQRRLSEGKYIIQNITVSELQLWFRSFPLNSICFVLLPYFFVKGEETRRLGGEETRRGGD